MTYEQYEELTDVQKKVAMWCWNNKICSPRQIARDVGRSYTTVHDNLTKLVGLYGNFWEAPCPIKSIGEDTTVEEKTVDASTAEPVSVESVLRSRGMEPDKWKTVWANLADPAKGVNGYRTTIKVVPRNDAQQVKPVIIMPHLSGSRKPDPPKMRNAFGVVLTDSHYGFTRLPSGELQPYHDRRALGAILAMCRSLKPDIIVHAGDLMDFEEISRFSKSPLSHNTVQNAAVEAGWYMHQLAQTAKRCVFIPGNHDQRLQRLVWEKAPMFEGLRTYLEALNNGPEICSVEYLCGMRPEWEVMEQYPNGRLWVNDNFMLCHGKTLGADSGLTVRAMLQKQSTSSGQGHSHRLEAAFKSVMKSHGKRVMAAYNFGCTCHIDGRLPGSDPECNWQQGVGAFWFDHGDGKFAVNLTPIFEGELSLGMHTYRDADYYEEFLEDTKWKMR